MSGEDVIFFACIMALFSVSGWPLVMIIGLLML